MWIEFKNLNIEQNTQTTVRKRKSPAKKDKNNKQSELLQAVEAVINETPIVNREKVKAVKQKIEQNNLAILSQNLDIVKDSAMKIANKMLNLENDLFGETN